MPLIKYQIRNEYSLADPELYRAADKDDPEALLEGVAMAGLVGVLRQLGDLAEFAAEIFHDLHEEVMATAARGHGLMVRVRQFEAEFPSVEKEFLSQTSHSPFFYNAGADWHPKLHMDQNVIACGDLPRFIMDSYEECRGPPRLFLLDKFDVAGAGACLKRYTDPSVFKVEAPCVKMSNAEVQREKKIRRIKKKAVRMRNGETPEVLPTAHAKLHQLFLEERIENGITDPSRRVKLKRRLPAFPLDSRPGTSYMEKFLNIASPEHKMVHEICINSSPLRLQFYNCSDSGTEILEIGTVTPLREESLKKRSPCSSPSLGRLLNPSFNELQDNIGTEEILTESEPSYKLEADDALSSLDRVLDEKEITVDGETKLEGSVDGYHSEDIASEIDSYMDALPTMESEMETDSVYQTKSDQAFLNIEKVGTDSDLCDEHLKTHFSDSHSMLKSIAFDDGNNSIRKGVSNLSYLDTPSILAETAPVIGDFLAKDLPPETFEDETSDVFPIQFSNNQEVLVSKSLDDVVPAGLLAEVGGIASCLSELGQASTSSSLTDEIPSRLPMDPEDIMMEDILTREMDELSSKWAKDYPAVISSEQDEEDSRDNFLCSINNLSDIASCKEVPPADIADNHPMNVLNEDVNAFSDVPTHSPKMLEAPKEESGENLLDDVLQTEYLEENVTREVSDSQVSLPSDEISLMEEQSSVPPLQESETCKLHSIASEMGNITEPVEDEAINLPHKLDAPDAVEEQMLKIADDFAKRDASYSGDQDADGPPSTDNGEKTCIINSNADLVRNDVSTLEVISDVSNSVDFASLTELLAHSEGEAAKAIRLETVPEATAVTRPSYEINALVSPMDFGVLQEKTLGDLSRVEQNGLQINEASVPQNYEQSDTQEVVRQRAVASPNSSSIVSNAASDNQPKSDSLDTIHVTSLAMEVKDSLHLDDATTMVSSSEHICQDYVSESTQHFHYIDNAEEASSSVLGEQAAASTNLDSILCSTEEAKSVLHLNDAIHVVSLAMEVEEKFHLDDATTIPPLSEHIGSDFVSEPTHNFDYVDNAEEASSSVLSEQAPASPNLHSIPYNTEEAKNDLHLNDVTMFPLSSEHSSHDITSARQSNLLEKIENVSFATVFHHADPSTSSEKVDLRYDQLNEESQLSTEATTVSHSEQAVTSNDMDHAQKFNLSPLSCQQPQSPVSDSFSGSGNGDNIVPEKNTVPSSTIFPEQAMVPSKTIFPCISLLPEPNQIELEEMPPLPPLPPMQWRMGKFQRTSLAPETDLMHDKVNPFPLLLPSPAEKKLEMGNPAMEEDILQPSVSFSPFSASKDENYQQSLQMQKMDDHGSTQEHSSTSDGIKSADPFLTLPAREMRQHVDCAELGENMQPCLNPVSAGTCSVSMHASGPLFEHINQVQSEVNLVDKKIDCGTGTLEEEIANPVGATPPIEEWQPQQISTTSDGEISSSAVADGKPNGKMKLPWPRNPLIDAVAALDKSKLRKATDRILPQIPKVDEKHSILEQIRTKSFNLKPAVTVRPSIQGPTTNLKVAAILEKANAIRQALAGSDEDDDADTWSDS